MTRCPACFRPEDAYHRLLGHCHPAEQPAPTAWRSQRRYLPPSRAHRIPRDDYLASVRVSDDEKRAKARERTRRWRQRMSA